MVLGTVWITLVVIFETLVEHIKFFIPTSLLPKDNISGEIALVTGAVWWNLFSPMYCHAL